MSDNQNRNSAINNFVVVGIGASAGGLSALEELFAHLPVNSGAAFVVIQHLSPDFKSLMKELLERRTQTPVYRVTEGMELQPNSVYLIPPGKNLVVDANLLRLEERKKDKNNKRELNFPIDLFFQSLAKNYAENSIGVILSGSGSDGTRGLRAISEAGGVTLVQEPETAEFDGMPLSAISTGIVNQILPPKELAQLIYQCITSPLNANETQLNNIAVLKSANLKEITNALIELENLDFSYYKISTMSRRIHRRRLINNLENIVDYIEFIKSSEEERKALCSDLLIKVTHFFRDKPAWEHLENNILPILIEKALPQEELRFWVTACSTGEEAYSLAILVNEALVDSDKELKVKIFATDIDRTALEKASVGIYPQSISNDITPERLRRYFIAQDDGYQVMRKLREMMIFSPHDLTKDAGFTRMHLISCRNVLIYMQQQLQHQVLRNLHFSLVDKGVLFLGEAETVGAFEAEFKSLDSQWKFFQKRRNIRLPIPLKANPKTSITSLLQSSTHQYQKLKTESIREQSLKRILNESNSIILLVSQENQLLHVCGNAQQIFKAPDGDFGSEITRMVVSPLQLPLNIALHRVKKEKKSVFYTGIKINDDVGNINLKVIPPEEEHESGNFNLVQIDYCPTSLPSEETIQPEKFEVDNEAQRRFSELDRELKETRENLQALVEELETTNEEQQASNEELTASNEELQSTNEELHSVNEELHTVNIEYQSKIQELTELNNDIDNLLKSTDIGVLFLDAQLRIRKFTPAATQAISLRQSDIDRPLEELSYKIDCPHLLELLQTVSKNKQPIEREVKLKEQEFYFLMRIHPYQTEDGQDNGIVISFVKIHEIKKVQQQLEGTLTALQQSEAKVNQLNRELEARVEARTNELNQANTSLQKEINIRKQTEAFLKIRLEQQAAIAKLGKQALTENKLDRLFQQATLLVAQNLNVEYIKILQLVEDGNSLLLRSGIGWSEGLVGKATVGTDLDSQAGYTLISNEPVVVEDLTTETRFSGSPLLKDRGVVSGISTIIWAREQPFGVFGAHTRQKRLFSQDDVNFLQAIANILSTAINAQLDKQTLLESEKRFRSAFEQAAVGVAHVAIDGTWLRVNQKLCQIFGYSQEELLQKTFQDITHPEDLDTNLEYVRQMLAGEIKTYSMEKRYIHQDSTLIWVNLTVSLVHKDSGEPDYFISVVEDIGDRKQTELALQENRQKLEQINLAKDAFIAHMSHELRTPLNSIIGFSDILRQNSSLLEEQLNHVNLIHQSGQHLLTLINDILDLSKIEANKLELVERDFNLKDFLDELIDIFRLRATQKGLNLHSHISADLPVCVKADVTRLRQVLLNLLSNAVKFTETGSIAVTVIPVKNTAENEIQTIRFQIEDTGKGIPKDNLESIFSPFQQLDSDQNQEGTGLGLTITHNLVQLMGSNIQVFSTVGQGSRFWFDLELTEIHNSNSCMPKKLKVNAIRHLKNPRKVLVVDDNADNRFLLVSYLKPRGFVTQEADNGKLGLDKVQTFQPDVILLDLMMPVMNGREIIKQIRQQKQFKNQIIFIISANISSKKLNCHAFIPKPVDLEYLLELLETHLQLEWITPQNDRPTLIIPPQNELIELLELINLGDIKAIQQKIKSLEELDSRYITFVREAKKLTANFQLHQLEQLVTRLLS